MNKVKRLTIKVPLKDWNELCKDVSAHTLNATPKEVEKSLVEMFENAVLDLMHNKDELLDRLKRLKRRNEYVT